MPLKVVVKDMPCELKTFDELPKGEFYRRVVDPRTTVYQKLNNQEYSIISDATTRPGGPWQLGPSARNHQTCVPIKATLTIEG